MMNHQSGNARYSGSRGEGQFHLPSGQDVLMLADDEKVEAELKRRGLWATMEQNARPGSDFLLCVKTRSGLDLFFWFGNARDGGLIWYAFPGATMDSPEVKSLIASAYNCVGFPGGCIHGLS